VCPPPPPILHSWCLDFQAVAIRCFTNCIAWKAVHSPSEPYSLLMEPSDSLACLYTCTIGIIEFKPNLHALFLYIKYALSIKSVLKRRKYAGILYFTATCCMSRPSSSDLVDLMTLVEEYELRNCHITSFRASLWYFSFRWCSTSGLLRQCSVAPRCIRYTPQSRYSTCCTACYCRDRDFSAFHHIDVLFEGAIQPSVQ
jgi:hypothetical protein